MPTRYSPVRRCTRFRRTVLARLACVKPAANVRSEPGSNSPVKLLFVPSFGAFEGTEARLLELYIYLIHPTLTRELEKSVQDPKVISNKRDTFVWDWFPIQFSKTEPLGLIPASTEFPLSGPRILAATQNQSRFFFQSVFSDFSPQPRVAISSIGSGGVNVYSQKK